MIHHEAWPETPLGWKKMVFSHRKRSSLPWQSGPGNNPAHDRWVPEQLLPCPRPSSAADTGTPSHDSRRLRAVAISSWTPNFAPPPRRLSSPYRARTRLLQASSHVLTCYSGIRRHGWFLGWGSIEVYCGFCGKIGGGGCGAERGRGVGEGGL